MRSHHLLVPAAVAAMAALLAATGSARTDRPALNVPVRITESSCHLDHLWASHKSYSTFVFGVQNNGKVAHGFDISAKYKTGLIAPGQEATIIATFTKPGKYTFACVSAHATVKKGVFTLG